MLKKCLFVVILSSTFGMGILSPQYSQANDTFVIAKKAEALPLFVMVKASWCPACKKIDPALKTVMKKYAKKAQFITLDVSNNKNKKEAEAEAKKMGLEKFYEKFKARTATVAIIHPETKKVLKIFSAESKSEVYFEALDKAIDKI